VKSDDLDRTDRLLKDTLSAPPSGAFEKKASEVFSAFRGSLPSNRPQGRSRIPRFLRWPSSVTLLAGTGIGCVLAVMAVFFLRSTPSWADVSESFRTAPFFSVTVYRRDNATSQPEQYELWVANGNLLRLKYGSTVAFGNAGSLTRAFDIEKRSEVTVDRRAQGLVEMLGDGDTFSFDSLVRSISGDLEDVTPRVIADEIVSKDMVAFDLVSDHTPEWMRIWALRESRLPVHLRVWDPRDGDCVDAIFSYSMEQPKEFFDAEAFEKALTEPGRRSAELAYLSLKEPVGRMIAPGKPAPGKAFQVTTTTLDGQPWSLGDHRGKAVFLHFWDTSFPSPPEEWIYELYERFGGRDDFVMAGVALGSNAELVRTKCDQWDMRWLQLYEPGRGISKNTLARALGVVGLRRPVLIWKDGFIKEVDDPSKAGMVEGAVLGVTYESIAWVGQRIQQMYAEKRAFSKQETEALCGKPDSVEDAEGGVIWHYRPRNDEGTREQRLNLRFDSEGLLAGFSSSGSHLIDPATLEVYIGPEFWKREIEDKIDPRYLEGLGERYELTVRATQGRRHSPFKQTAIDEMRTGHTWSRELPFGSYGVLFTITDRQVGRIEWTLTLVDEVSLDRNEKKTLRFK